MPKVFQLRDPTEVVLGPGAMALPIIPVRNPGRVEGRIEGLTVRYEIDDVSFTQTFYWRADFEGRARCDRQA